MNFEVTQLYNHPYNNTITNERSVEVPLGLRFLEMFNYDVIEIGAVMTHYSDRTKYKSIDPTDSTATINGVAEDYNYIDKNVLSISTIEHIGTGQYGVKKQSSAVEVLEKLHGESKSCLISWPIGFNKTLDSYVKENYEKFNYFFYIKKSQNPLKWEISKEIDNFDNDYNKPFPAGNYIIFITKNLNNDNI